MTKTKRGIGESTTTWAPKREEAAEGGAVLLASGLQQQRIGHDEAAAARAAGPSCVRALPLSGGCDREEREKPKSDGLIFFFFAAFRSSKKGITLSLSFPIRALCCSFSSLSSHRVAR